MHVVFLVARDDAEHVQRLQLSIDRGPWLLQAFPDVSSQRTRNPREVVDDGEPERRHAVARAPDGETQRATPLEADGDGAAHNLEQLFDEARRVLWRMRVD